MIPKINDINIDSSSDYKGEVRIILIILKMIGEFRARNCYVTLHSLCKLDMLTKKKGVVREIINYI